MNRKALTLLSVVALVLLAGCATMSVETTVSDANTIEEYKINATMPTTVYGYLQEQAKEGGYDSLEESVTDEFPDDSSVEYEETIDGGDTTITITASDLDVDEMQFITIEEQEGELVFSDDRFVDENPPEDQAEGFVLKYTVNMPGEITESNADEVDGNTATWRLTGEDAYAGETFEARSETGSSVFAPGFSAGVTVVALGLSTLVVYVNRRRE